MSVRGRAMKPVINGPSRPQAGTSRGLRSGSKPKMQTPSTPPAGRAGGVRGKSGSKTRILTPVRKGGPKEMV